MWKRRHGVNANIPNLSNLKSKPFSKRKVLRWVVQRRVHTRNVMALKAYCVAAHSKLRRTKRGNKMISSLGTFLYRFGAKRRGNAIGEYGALLKTYRRFYKYGLGRYLLNALSRSMRHKGVLTRRGKLWVLKHNTLGLRHHVKDFDKWGVSNRVFQHALKGVMKREKGVVRAAKAGKKFRKSHCTCQTTHRFKKYGTCKKWFKYDKAPWCQVHSGCKGATKMKSGFKWKPC
jgi:hypothetical protein